MLQATNYKLQDSKGFTIVESLVAIAVFTVGISAAIFVINQSIGASTRTKNKIIAGYLAQEGIEVVRNIRDRNWLAGNSWYAGIDGINSGCVSYSTDNVDAPLDPDCFLGTYLAFDGTQAHYIQTATPTQFQRTVATQLCTSSTVPPCNPERLKVTSTVTCGANCSVSLEEYLYNWK